MTSTILISHALEIGLLTAADLLIKDGTLVVSLTSTKDKIFSLTTRVEIPLSKIDSVSTDPVEIDEWRTVKVAGARWPSYFAGRFYVFGKGKKFFLFGNRNRCITLKLKNFKYKEVIIEVEDKEATASRIINVLAG
jgi:PH (Pleckstrin Homology) domain-containing protein